MDGPSDRHYVSAVQYILEASENLQDDYVVPGLINREYGESFLDLRDVVLNRVNYSSGRSYTARVNTMMLSLSSIPSGAFRMTRFTRQRLAISSGSSIPVEGIFKARCRAFKVL